MGYNSVADNMGLSSLI